MNTWNIDAKHSTIEFAVRHMMITTVKGTFEQFEGVIEFDEANPSHSTVTAKIRTASVNTRTPDRDNHLRSGDFFDSENYEFMTFTSKRIEVTGDNTANVIGDLTIRDTTHEVVLEAELTGQGTNPYGMTVAGFTATTKINREDFGLTWNVALEAGGVLVSKEVKITLDLQAVKAVPATA